MTYATFIGCLLIAYAPSAILLLAYASRRSALLILTICGAFAWLLAIFGASSVWAAIPPARGVTPYIQVVSIVAQEAARLGLVWAYAVSELAADRLVAPGGPKIFNDLSAGIAAGLGFGAMHTVMMYGAVIFASVGEPTFFLDSCPQLSIFTWTAALALLYNVLHITLTVIALDAWRRSSSRSGRAMLALPLAVHLVFGLLTLATANTGGCVVVLPIAAVIVAATAVLVWRIERSPDFAAKRQQRAWDAFAAEEAGTR